RERRGLPLYTRGVAGSGRRFAQSAAQRRRQRRYVRGTDAARAPAAIPRPATKRIPRLLQPGGEFLPRSGAGDVRRTDRRSSGGAATGLAGTRESAATASLLPRVFRCLLAAGRGGVHARVPGAVDEALGGRERRARRRRMRPVPRRGFARGC